MDLFLLYFSWSPEKNLFNLEKQLIIMPGKRRPMSEREREMHGHILGAETHNLAAHNYAFAKTTIGTLLFFFKRISWFC